MILGILSEYLNQRQYNLIKYVEEWASKRGIGVVIDHGAKLKGYKPFAIYVPMTWHSAEAFAHIDRAIPLILDVDSGNPDRIIIAETIARNRRLAVRNFAWNNDTTRYSNNVVEFIVPYIHLPIPLSKMPKDTILVDHAINLPEFLKLLTWLANTEHGTYRWYFNNGRGPRMASVISKMAEYLGWGQLDLCFIRDMMPPISNDAEYNALFARVCEFVTTRTNINDVDIFNAYINGAKCINVLNIGTNYHHPLAVAMCHLEPKLANEFERLKAAPAIRDNVPAELYDNAFYKTWDMLVQWASYHKIDRKLMQLSK